MSGEQLDWRTRELVKAVAEQSVRETFRLLGVDMADQDAVNSMRDDLRFTRAQREVSEKRRDEMRKGTLTGVVTIVTGAIMGGGAVLWAILGGKGGVP